MDNYRSRYTFAIDFGTSDFKFGPISCGDTPRIIHNRGYFPDKRALMMKAFATLPDVVVGENVTSYLQSSAETSSRLVYPMRNGVIEKDEGLAWEVVRALTEFALTAFRSSVRYSSSFKGYYLVAAVSSVSPRYMYERMFEIFEEVNNGGALVNAATILPQPFAVAIGHGITACVVVESGHGNTQICPISMYPIRESQLPLNRGGGDANAITAEILKDCGYGDVAQEESIVRMIKENVGLIPADLESAIKTAKDSPAKVRGKFKIPGTRLEIDFASNSWMRFLIGEYVFNPNHDVFESYFTRGMRRPRNTKIGNSSFPGMMDLGEAIVTSVERCPVELQPLLYKEILLSGGNFNWTPPKKLEGIAVDAPTKVKQLLRDKGIRRVTVRMTKNPQFSVWHGCIIYGYAVPPEYGWTWERFEGWMALNGSRN